MFYKFTTTLSKAEKKYSMLKVVKRPIFICAFSSILRSVKEKIIYKIDIYEPVY